MSNGIRQQPGTNNSRRRKRDMLEYHPTPKDLPLSDRLSEISTVLHVQLLWIPAISVAARIPNNTAPTRNVCLKESSLLSEGAP